MKRKSYKDLERENMELRAQMPHASVAACRDLEKAGAVLMASAAIITITALGGRVIVGPVAIRDGLSSASITALRGDISRSHAAIVAAQPKT